MPQPMFRFSRSVSRAESFLSLYCGRASSPHRREGRARSPAQPTRVASGASMSAIKAASDSSESQFSCLLAVELGDRLLTKPIGQLRHATMFLDEQSNLIRPLDWTNLLSCYLTKDRF